MESSHAIEREMERKRIRWFRRSWGIVVLVAHQQLGKGALSPESSATPAQRAVYRAWIEQHPEQSMAFYLWLPEEWSQA